MPIVGKKHFPYTKKGKAAAKKAAKKTGQKMTFDKMRNKMYGLAKKEDMGKA